MNVLDRPRVLELLAQGATVVTPNRRLALDLKRAFDAAQQAAGRRAWLAADALAWPSWVARCFGEIDPPAPRPALLAPLQEALLWRQIVRSSRAAAELPHAELLAATAREAWDALLDEGGPAGLDAARALCNDDQLAFRGWAREFERRARALRAVSAAQVPALIADALAGDTWRPRSPVALAGFDRLTARQQAVLAALQACGAAIEAPRVKAPAQAAPLRIASADLRTQWCQVAAWARDRLHADPAARIGIVVPDLGAQREAIVSALTDALVPALRVAPDPAAARPFNLSLGRPLASQPLVATALLLFDLLLAPCDAAQASRLLRSPFLAGGAAGEAEWARRARLDRALRDQGAWRISFDALRRAAGRRSADGQPHPDSAPQLAQALDRVAARLAAAGRPRRQSVPDWVALLFEVLSAAGYPGSRALDSVEYQCHARWRELLASLGSLDAVAGPMSLAEAIALLRRAALDTLFQPQSPEVPVQVLGVLESAHLPFDHLWIANLSEDRWPPPAQPNALLPLLLQRAWGLPHAAPELALERARRQMTAWAAATREFVVSHAALEADRPALPSPLIAEMPAAAFNTLAVQPLQPVAALLRQGDELHVLGHDLAPPLTLDADTPLRGGTRVIADQSACAFRAFATHRLHAQPLPLPAPGLDAAARGRLLHDTLAGFWTGLASQADLRALDDRALHERVARCAEQALATLARERPGLFGERLRALEHERLLRTVHAWIEVEDQRAPFSVLAVEQAGEIELAGLRLSVRPDRIDRLADGSVAIIDFKTGQVALRDWLDERPAQPQLPLYALACEQGALTIGALAVGAIAFAQLKPGRTQFVALAAQDGLLPGARVVAADEAPIRQPGWSGLLDDWRAILRRLAQDFRAGDAAVAPRSLATSCRYCALALLCRREERLSWGGRLADESAVDGGDA